LKNKNTQLNLSKAIIKFEIIGRAPYRRLGKIEIFEILPLGRSKRGGGGEWERDN
jgi:hypothetical protein